MKLPEKLLRLAPYDPPQKPYPPIKMDANESFLPWEEAAMDRVRQALEAVPLHRYPDPTAQEICRAAADLFGVSPSQIVAGNGSDELISLLFSAFLPRGAKVVLCEPDFSMYAFYAQIYELSHFTMDKDNLHIDVHALARAAADASMLILSNPCNPTGQGLGRDDVLFLAQSLPNCLVVIDEAYMDFWDQSVVDAIPLYGNLLILRTCSKALGMAGIRLGFALGQKSLIEALVKIKSPFNINALTQAVASALLTEKELHRRHIEQIMAGKQHLERLLSAFPVTTVQTQTNFILVKMQDAARCQKALAGKGISVRLTMGDYLRVTVGSPMENEAFAAALDDYLANR